MIQVLIRASQFQQRTPFLNRTQVLLQAAQQKEVKKADEAQTVVQECKQWDIPMLSIRTASTSVSKLMKKYQPAEELSSLKKVMEVARYPCMEHLHTRRPNNPAFQSAVLRPDIIFPTVLCRKFAPESRQRISSGKIDET